MSTTYQVNLKKEYKERIVPALMKEFNYTSVMQAPKLEKIVINQGLGAAVADRKIIETGIEELTAITGQKAVQTISRKDISNFKLRKKMPVGVRVTLRHDKMYEFLERLIRVALPVFGTLGALAPSWMAAGTTRWGSRSRLFSPRSILITLAGYRG